MPGTNFTNVADNTIRITVTSKNRKISYAGPDGYVGHLDYDIENGSSRTLVIKTMIARPEGKRLGSLLIWQASLDAITADAMRMEACLVAVTAQAFYRANGFHPSPSSRDDLETTVMKTPVQPPMSKEFAERLYCARTIPRWSGETAQIQKMSFDLIHDAWV